MKPGTDNKDLHSPVAGRFGLDRRKASRSDIGYTSRMYGVLGCCTGMSNEANMSAHR